MLCGNRSSVLRCIHLFLSNLPNTDIDARPWDFQAEECTLRANIEAFNSRRYDRPQDSEFSPVDNCLQSVLGQRLDLPEDFHYSYELWLEREVFSQPICWEELLQNHWLSSRQQASDRWGLAPINGALPTLPTQPLFPALGVLVQGSSDPGLGHPV